MYLPLCPPLPFTRTSRFWRLLLLFPTLFLAPWGSSASAATLNVPAQYGTIQAAITATQDGDTVLIADGTYSGPGNVDLSLAGRKITITSRNGAGTTIIDCGGQATGSHRAFAFQPGDIDAAVNGFTIRNGYEDAGGGILINSGSRVTVSNCVFVQNSAVSPGYPQGGGIYNAGLVSMTNCILMQNSAEGGYGGLGAGFANNGTATVTNCTFLQNIADGGSGGGVFNNSGSITVNNCTFTRNNAKLGGGLANDGAANVTNCTFTQNVAALYGGGLFSSFGTGTIVNNIFFNDTGNSLNEIGYAGGPENAVILAYCDVQGGYAGTGNINADPLFVSAATGDLHLKPGSPCRGAGTSAGAPTTDLDGHTRPNPPSIGAYDVVTSHTHLLWTSPDGRAVLWDSKADGSFGDHGQYGPYTDAGGTWHAVALATGPDGVSRLLWTSPDGRAVLWYVTPDGSHGDGGQFGPYTDAGGTWRATAVSVGSDDLPHLLWTHPDGRSVLWDGHADGTYTNHGQYGPYTDAGGTWKASALSVGPDDLPHLLWDNPDGREVLWNGHANGTYSDHGQYGPYTDAGGTWRATALSVGPDNLPHLLWSNPDGRSVLWDGHADGTYTNRGQYGPYTDGGGTWAALTVAVGPDDLPHLLWTNPDGRAVLWDGNGDGTYSDHGQYGPYTDGGGTWRAVAASAGP